MTVHVQLAKAVCDVTMGAIDDVTLFSGFPEIPERRSRPLPVE